MKNVEKNNIGRWILILYRYGNSYINRKLEHYNIGKGQHFILLTLFRNGGISQEALSSYLQLDKGSIAKSVKKLEDRAYIERSFDLIDKRVNKVSLTQKGLDIIPVIQEVIQSLGDILLSELSESEKQEVNHLLFKMARTVYNIKVNGNVKIDLSI